MKNRKKLVVRYIFMALSVLIMVLIFCFSSQDGYQSGSLSGNFATAVQNVFNALHMPSAADFFVTYIRKFAHAFIYAALGLCVSICAFTYDFKYKWLWILLPFIICFLYACSDEVHQLFINGRDGKFTDVLIDSIGIVAAVLISNLVWWLIRRKTQNI